MEVSGIILAGGKNQRLGRNKALEVIGGETMIERVIERLTRLCGQILIVTSAEQSRSLPGNQAKILVDLYPAHGPLGGIYTGLLASQSPQNIVVACDMPFLNSELLRYMIELSGDFNAVVPRLSEGRLEPLHAIYSKSCLSSIEVQLKQNQLNVRSFYQKIRVRYVEQDECQKLDSQLLSFFNINYQSDLDKANRLLREGILDRDLIETKSDDMV